MLENAYLKLETDHCTMNKPRKRIITEISGVGDGELSSMLAMGQKHKKRKNQSN